MSLSKFNGSQIAASAILDSHIAAGAAIATSKLADGASFLKADGSVAATAAISGVSPTLPAHFATKSYVDSIASGLDTKASVRVATTANIALTGTQTIDGVLLVAGDRVLVKNQTTASQNGIYVVAAGAWSLAADSDSSAEVTTGLHTFVEQGTTLGGSGWVLTTPMPITVGTTGLTFAQFSGGGTYSAGNGLTLTGNQFNVVSGNGGIVTSADQIALTLADSTLTVGGTGLRLSSLTSGNLLVGNGSNVATGVPMTGAVTMSNSGVTALGAGVVGATNIAANVVDETKLKRQTAGTLLVGQGAGTDVLAVGVSGDVTMTQAGVFTLAGSVVRVEDFITNETPTGLINGVNTSFVLANVPRAQVVVMYNGQIQESGAGNDYTISGNTITTLFAPAGTDKIRVNYIK